MTQHDSSGGVEGLDRAMEIIEALARLGPSSLSALARETGINPATALRILRTLQARHYTVQERARGPWLLGPRWRAIGAASANHGGLPAVVQPFLDRLAVDCGEAVYLDAMDGFTARTMALSRPDPRLPLFSRLNAPRFLHAGAPRLLLAYARPELRDAVLRQKLPRLTAATRTDPAWLAADLRRLRSLGWLLAQDETANGEITLAVPVHDGAGRVPLVLSLSAARVRLSPARARTFLPHLLGAAAQLGAAIGIAPGIPPAPHPGEDGGGLAEGGEIGGPSRHPARISPGSRPPKGDPRRPRRTPSGAQQFLARLAPAAPHSPWRECLVQCFGDGARQILGHKVAAGMMASAAM